MNKLKPCPFCGGKAELVEGSDGWCVYCKECDCEMVRFTKKQAVKIWNTRRYNDCPPPHDVEEYYKEQELKD